ncbi:MAG: hypothetical protein R2686_07165 [Candidatus Nanopelagicales bacterium]
MSDDAAARRTDYVRALLEERRGYEMAGLSDRVKAVDAELARFDAAPKKRSTPKRQNTAAEETAT